MEWNCGNVQKWLLWTEHLYRLPQVGKAFQDLDGKDLCSMSEEDFRQRSPQCSETLHAHLDIWKSGEIFGSVNAELLRKELFEFRVLQNSECKNSLPFVMRMK